MRKLLFVITALVGLTLVQASQADELIQPRLDIPVPHGRLQPPTDTLPSERPVDFHPPWPQPWLPRPDDPRPMPRPWPKPYPPTPRPRPDPYGPCFLLVDESAG
jgi:hypothetical protein